MDSVTTVNYQTEDTQSSGITPNLGQSNNLEQVQLVKVEETNTILKLPRFPGQTIDTEKRLLKACQLATRYLALRTTISVSGRGVQVYAESDQGKTVSATIRAASGPFYITFPTGTQVERVTQGRTNDGNTHTWSAELFCYAANTGSQTQNLITLPSEVTALLPSPAVKVIQQTTTMSGDIKQNVKNTYQVTCHLAS